MLEKLNPRERLLMTGLLALIAIGLLGLGGSKIRDMRAKKREDVGGFRDMLGQISSIRDTIRELPPAPNPPERTQLVADASRLAEKHKLKATDIRDREETSRRFVQVHVELTFNGVPLMSVLELIHDVEYGKQIAARVSRLVFRRSLPTKEVYDVNLTLSAQKPRETKGGKEK